MWTFTVVNNAGVKEFNCDLMLESILDVFVLMEVKTYTGDFELTDDVVW